MSEAITVALIDGPLPREHPALVRRIDLAQEVPAEGPAGLHAAAIAGAMLAQGPRLRLVNLVVFGDRLATDSASIVRALEVAEQSEAEVVHCSLGLARRDPAIAAAVARLVERGRLLVAAAAARGGPVYPAALPGVVSVQGDARCGAALWSYLGLPTALFGACPRLADRPEVGGASVAAAHLTGHLARLAASGAQDPVAALRAGAAYVGRERRR